MSKREEFIATINVFRATSKSITQEQRIGLLKQAVQEFGLTTDEGTAILNASGLIVGDGTNYLEALGLSLDEIHEGSDATIMIRVNSAHKTAYSASLRAGGLPRADGRTQEQWRTLLNHARDTLSDPQNRSQYLEKLGSHNIESQTTSDDQPTIPEVRIIDETTDKIQEQIQRIHISDTNYDTEVEPPEQTPQDMAFIPGGNFLMGSDEKQNKGDNPLHTVYVDSFFMDKYPVTNRQFKDFVDANPQWRTPSEIHIFNIKWNKTKEKPEHDGDYLKHWHGNNYPEEMDDHPVVWVSWYAAMAYAEWKGKRLPSEAEWEKAARGGISGQNYPWGNAINPTVANYHNTIGDTTEVGKYPANGYGLYDMAGNVWEWCLDVYDADFYHNSQQQNPISGANSVNSITKELTDDSVLRVLRGGSWLDAPIMLQTDFRYKNNPIRTLGWIGFRCVKTVTS